MSSTPLWIGAFAHEKLSRPSWPINILRVDKEATVFDPHAGSYADLGAALIGKVSCHGVPVLLLASPVE